jgi:hypothetical protein
LNVHGVPIVFSAQDAINDMAFNLDEARDQGLEQPILVIGNFK